MNSVFQTKNKINLTGMLSLQISIYISPKGTQVNVNIQLQIMFMY